MRILYIDIDSQRPDHLGCYGYHRNTSPHIDAIAAEGTVFTNFYTPDAPCLPSRTAFYTGMFGIHSGVVGHGGTAADLRVEGPSRSFRDRIELQSLPSALQYAGIHTAQISPFGQRHAARQFYAGFNEIHNTGKGGMESAEEVTPTVLKWLRENAKNDNWYLHVNYWDPHTPYRTPANFGEPFADEPLPAWLTEEKLREHQQLVGPHKALEISMFDDREDARYPKHPGALRNMSDLRRMIDGYDNGTKYVDDQIGLIVAELRKAGVWDDLLVVISADHGENQGELGIYGEHGTADQITCRVPFIVKGPNIRKGATDDGLHYNLDFAPTLLDYLGLPQLKQPIWDGQSFLPALTTGATCGRDYLVVSQCAHVCQRSVRWEDYLYIRTYHCGGHLFPSEMLFNLATDPHEQNDLAPERPELCGIGARKLSEWHEARMKSMPYDTDPLWTVMKEGGPFHFKGRMKDYAKHLEKTNRAWAIEELKRRYPLEFA